MLGRELELPFIQPRGKKELAVTILRARIKIRQTVSHMLTGDVGYLRITSFMQENLHQEVARLVRDLQTKGAKALVIDLRNNPGGLLPQAHQIPFEHEGARPRHFLAEAAALDGVLVERPEVGRPGRVEPSAGHHCVGPPFLERRVVEERVRLRARS